MFWKSAAADKDKKEDKEEIKGTDVMPAAFGFLLVLLAAFQLFYRYESWQSKTNESITYERDRLTGETHVVFPGDKVGILARITGQFGHDPEDVSEKIKHLESIPEPALESALMQATVDTTRQPDSAIESIPATPDTISTVQQQGQPTPVAPLTYAPVQQPPLYQVQPVQSPQ